MDIIKCALQHFVMKVGCYVTDDGGNYVTFHELNRRSRKDLKNNKSTVWVSMSFKARLQLHHGLVVNIACVGGFFKQFQRSKTSEPATTI